MSSRRSTRISRGEGLRGREALAFEAAAKRAEELAGHSEITSGTLTGMFLSCRWPIDTGEHTGSFTLSVFHGEFEAERSSIVGLSVHEVGIFERYAPVVPETARQVIAAYDEGARARARGAPGMAHG